MNIFYIWCCLWFQEEEASLQLNITNLQNQLEEKNKSHVELKEEFDSVKKEQDDLLLLLSDQEEKLHQYKLQLKSLGAEVISLIQVHKFLLMKEIYVKNRI